MHASLCTVSIQSKCPEISSNHGYFLRIEVPFVCEYSMFLCVEFLLEYVVCIYLTEKLCKISCQVTNYFMAFANFSK